MPEIAVEALADKLSDLYACEEQAAAYILAKREEIKAKADALAEIKQKIRELRKYITEIGFKEVLHVIDSGRERGKEANGDDEQ